MSISWIATIVLPVLSFATAYLVTSRYLARRRRRQ